MSRAMIAADTIRELASRTGETVIETVTGVPSFRMWVVSTRSIDSPPNARWMISSCCPSRLGGSISATDSPIASSTEYPYSRSAPRFQLVIVPPSSLVRIASSDESTT